MIRLVGARNVKYHTEQPKYKEYLFRLLADQADMEQYGDIGCSETVSLEGMYGSYICSLKEGHDGEHIAYDEVDICAVWETPKKEPKNHELKWLLNTCLEVLSETLGVGPGGMVCNCLDDECYGDCTKSHVEMAIAAIELYMEKNK